MFSQHLLLRDEINSNEECFILLFLLLKSFGPRGLITFPK